MEKIDNIQKEEIGGEHTLNEVPSESEYETETDDEIQSAMQRFLKDDDDDVPMDLKSEFITSLLAKNYSDSLKLCKIILRFSPDHELAKEYLPVLEEMLTLQQSEESEDEGEEESSEDDTDLSSNSDTSDESEDENLADSLESVRTHSGRART